MSSRRSIEKGRVELPGQNLLEVTGRVLALALAMVGVAGSLSGCQAPPPATPPPGGGARFVLPYDAFVAQVAPVLRRHGCAAEGGCHGGGVRGTFALSPETRPDVAYDFDQTRLQVDGYHPDRSALLLKPLAIAAGGSPHAVKVFGSREDADYRVLREWVARGVFE